MSLGPTRRTLVSDDRTPLLAEPNESDAEPLAMETHDDLRKVADSIPYSVWLVATVELCERFAFYGVVGPMQNYIQNGRDDPARPGGIGLGQFFATIINQGFMFWCFITPLMGAVVAEQYVGRVKTVIYSSGVYSCGLVTLFLTSLRFSQDAGISLPGLILALFFIGIGTGGIKANMSSLIAEQYTGPEAVIRVLKSGEKVVVDGELTLQRMFNTLIFYINVGSFAAFATTLIEQKYGFSSAFALSTIVFLIGFVIALANQGHYICNEPENSLIFDVCRALWIAIKHKCDLNNARPTVQAEESPHQRLLPDGSFVDDLEKILSACKVFCLYPFFWAAYSQFQTNFISQAATMETHGIPNDMMTNINPIATLILLPALDRIIFPWLSNRGVPIHHANRMTVGFMFGGLAMLYASLIQQKIYRAPPCYDHPRAQNCLDGRVPNSVSVLFQVPAYVLITSSEVLASVAGIEYAYTKAPKTMKSLITSVYLSTMSVGVLLAMTVSPLTVDPKLPWMYFIIGVGTLMAGIILRCAPL